MCVLRVCFICKLVYWDVWKFFGWNVELNVGRVLLKDHES